MTTSANGAGADDARLQEIAAEGLKEVTCPLFPDRFPSPGFTAEAS